MKNYQMYLDLFVVFHNRQPANGTEFVNWCAEADRKGLMKSTNSRGPVLNLLTNQPVKS